MLESCGYTVVGLDLAPVPQCAHSYAVDVSDPTAVESVLDEVERSLGPITAVVTAAGYYERVDVLEIDETKFDRIVDVLVNGTANVCRSALRRMLPRGTGSICTIGSELGLCGDADAAHYAACKGAIHALTKSIAREAARFGVRVNCVAPGPTDTPLMTAELRDPAYIASLVLQRLVDPREIAAMVAFVLDANDHNLVGQVISPNAGAVV